MWHNGNNLCQSNADIGNIYKFYLEIKIKGKSSRLAFYRNFIFQSLKQAKGGIILNNVDLDLTKRIQIAKLSK